MTHTRASLSSLLSDKGLSPSRALGQNFVIDPNTVRRIARLADVHDSDVVLEIGAGLGSLTLALCETGAVVHAMEVDRHLIAPLQEVLANTGAIVHHDNALLANYDQILGTTPTVVVANLPYNIAATVVLHILETVPQVTRMLVMVQLEVGQRLAAHVGDDAFGAVSLRVQYFAHARVVGKVAPTVFLPRPKVDSALVEIIRRDAVAIDPSYVTEDVLFDVIKTSFGQRRKMLRRSLSAWATSETFALAGVLETARPEELTLQQFADLAHAR